jgi:hypothetical protein
MDYRESEECQRLKERVEQQLDQSEVSRLEAQWERQRREYDEETASAWPKPIQAVAGSLLTQG